MPARPSAAGRAVWAVQRPYCPSYPGDTETMPQVKHVVLLRLKSDTTDAQVDEMMATLAGLLDKIPGLLDFSGGAYSSTEGLSKGFTHGFVMTFADEASRDAYLPHPEHEAVKKLVFGLLEGGLDGVVAFDWLAS